MWGWIPIIGPIVDGIVAIVKGHQDTSFKTHQTDVDFDKTSVEASKGILETFKDDIGLRFLRDLAITPVVIWSALIGWDTIVALRWPWLKFQVADYPEGVRYIPYMVYTFLFGAIGLVYWKRR